jgi:hypothetical protein
MVKWNESYFLSYVMELVITEKPSYSVIDCNVFLHVTFMCYSLLYLK